MSKVALITGASKGIGLEIAKVFKENSYIVAGLSLGGGPDLYKCDIRNENQVKDTLKKVKKDLGEISILVNNAGIVSFSNIEEMPFSEWSNVFDTNITGPFNLCKYVLPDMKKNNYGKIINISSIAGLTYSKSASVAYTASKHALNGFTQHLAAEYAKYNININAICPSQTKTRMLDHLNANVIKNLENKNPKGRLLFPNEIARMALFLANDECNYMNGAMIPITGGL